MIFVIVAAYEIPNTLHHLNSSNSASSSSTPTPTAPATPPVSAGIPKSLLRRAPVDPFASTVGPAGDPQVGPAIDGGRDPFGASTPPAAQAAPAASSPLPQKIVLGTPGKGRVAVHGWIVILASIPTGEGRGSAATFAARASQNGIGSLSILNSSNSRPLRGGYWVVYSGPYETLGAVTARASAIHASGYGTAYIRELIVYR